MNAMPDTDLRRAGLTDDLAASTHCGEVALLLQRKMTERSYDLTERAAEVCAGDKALRRRGAGTGGVGDI